jgi:hypothetical protein
MPSNKDKIIPWGCVYEVTFPSQKIYVGSDTAKTAYHDFFKYFGSPGKAAKDEMLKEMSEYLEEGKEYIVKKNILYAEKNVRVGDILKIEQKYIKALKAKDPDVGYNR